MGFLGLFNSYLYRKYLRRRNPDWIVFLAEISIGVVLVLDCLIYFNIINMTWLEILPWIDMPSAEPGKYFMWNSFLVIGLAPNITPQPGMEIIGLFLMISYVGWYYFASKLGKILFGYREYQQGLMWVFKPVKKIQKEREKQESR